jgi:aminopeptidase-like protein
MRGARLLGPGGEVIADASRLNLHLLNYSVPFRGKVSLQELQDHLYSLPEAPDLVPYRTSYYREAWGFCLSHSVRASLSEGEYRVEIDTTLADGSLTYGEVALVGEEDREVLVSTHCCHPSLANDNCAGMVMCAELARILSGMKRRYTYRFLFVPGTIGAITWLALNEDAAGRIAHGLVAACAGDGGRLTYKRSQRGEAEIDRATALVLQRSGAAHEVRAFTPYGYDERQYNSPGFDLPVGSLTRTPYGEYPEYHTSADDPSLVKPEKLVDTSLPVPGDLRGAGGKRRLPESPAQVRAAAGQAGPLWRVGGDRATPRPQMAMLWVLNQSDGSRSLSTRRRALRLALLRGIAGGAGTRTRRLAPEERPAEESPVSAGLSGVALVTGASSGIGLALATALGARGCAFSSPDGTPRDWKTRPREFGPAAGPPLHAPPTSPATRICAACRPGWSTRPADWTFSSTPAGSVHLGSIDSVGWEGPGRGLSRQPSRPFPLTKSLLSLLRAARGRWSSSTPPRGWPRERTTRSMPLRSTRSGRWREASRSGQPIRYPRSERLSGKNGHSDAGGGGSLREADLPAGGASPARGRGGDGGGALMLPHRTAEVVDVVLRPMTKPRERGPP